MSLDMRISLFRAAAGIALTLMVVLMSVISVKAQSLPTLFLGSINGQPAYAYLTDYFEIYWLQSFHHDLLEAGGEVARDPDSPRDVPQKALIAGNLLEEARRMVVQVLGYQHPVGALNNKMPVFLDKLPEGLYGFATIRDDGLPYLVVNPFIDDLSVKTTIAHEYFHAVQFGYDVVTHDLYANLKPNEPFSIPTKMAEGSAVWVENKVYSDSVLYRERLKGSPITDPERGIFGEARHHDGEEHVSQRYGSFLWYHFLSKKFGDDTVKKLWAEYFRLSKLTGDEAVPRMIREYKAHRNVFESLQTSMTDVFSEFMVWNMIPKKYQEAFSFPELNFRYSGRPDAMNEVRGAFPEAFGSNYFRFETGELSGTLKVEFDGSDQAIHAVMMLPIRGSEQLEDRIVKKVIESGSGGSIEIALDHYDSVILGIGVADIADSEVNQENPFDGRMYPFAMVLSVPDNADMPIVRFGISDEAESVQTDAELTAQSSELAPLQKVFRDVPLRYPYALAITTLNDNGIVSGYPNKTFQPRRLVNRAELTKIVMNALGVEATEEDRNCFSDVRQEWFAPFICSAKRLGVVNGFPDGKFRPGESVEMTAAYKIVMEAWFDGIPETDGPWFYKYFIFADRQGLLHDNNFEVAKPMNRGEMAQLVWRVMENLKSMETAGMNEEFKIPSQ